MLISTHDRLLPVRLNELSQSPGCQPISVGLMAVEHYHANYNSQGASVPHRILEKEMRAVLPDVVTDYILDTAVKLEEEMRLVLYPDSLE